MLAIWAVVVGVTDNIVKPLLMRNRMEVHSAVIFFSLIGGLAAFGMAGLVAGPLIVSLTNLTLPSPRRTFTPPG